MKGGVFILAGVMIFIAGFGAGKVSSGDYNFLASAREIFSGEKVLAEIPEKVEKSGTEAEKNSLEDLVSSQNDNSADGLGEKGKEEGVMPQQVVFNINMEGAKVELKTDKVVLNAESLLDNETSDGIISEKVLASEEGKCEISDYKVPERRGVFISEVAWMGTDVSVNDEWIEIKNTSQNKFDLSGWEIRNKDGGLNIVFPEGSEIEAKEIMVLERSDDETVRGVRAGLIYKGVLGNSDEGIYLFDASCNLIDKAEAEGEWPAGEAKTKKTMERDWVTLEWKSSSETGGTPGSDNGIGSAIVKAGSEKKEEVSESVAVQNGGVEVSQGRICFSEVLAGSENSADDEYVKAVNLGDGEINLEGWMIKKKSSTGAETTLVSASLFQGKKIAGKGQMIFGHSEGYSGTADIFWPKSYSLAYENNGVIFYDKDGNKKDEINWEKLEKGEVFKKECK